MINNYSYQFHREHKYITMFLMGLQADNIEIATKNKIQIK